MAEPCRQEGNIAELKGNDARLFDVLGRIEKNQERFIEVLEQIAAQGERINHLETDVRRQETDANNLFGRVRILEMEPKGSALDKRISDLEKEPGKEANQVRAGFWNALIAAVIALVVGLMVKK
jgi:septal ring factor EnvC (AmiA/AmiB activator)